MTAHFFIIHHSLSQCKLEHYDWSHLTLDELRQSQRAISISRHRRPGQPGSAGVGLRFFGGMTTQARPRKYRLSTQESRRVRVFAQRRAYSSLFQASSTIRRQINRHGLFEFGCGVTLRVKKTSVIYLVVSDLIYLPSRPVNHLKL